ncbi:TetR/AcrR family transcriptional regulator [Actinokineospora soli]|uniref:TetR/AcrR family transcriptional regulator n=1 Tax=Actinokineospora soli TaxID=1048753 RepID=A0ABW2TM14_9PSEU
MGGPAGTPPPRVRRRGVAGHRRARSGCDDGADRPRGGVARPQLYKHFADTADLQSAIADRAVEQVVAELAPLLDLRGTPMQMINEAIGSHVAWLVDNSNLYQYLNARSSTAGKRAITDVKTAVATHVTTLFEFYLGAFGVDKRPAEPLAFGVVGMVETTTARWVTNPVTSPRPPWPTSSPTGSGAWSTRPSARAGSSWTRTPRSTSPSRGSYFSGSCPQFISEYRHRVSRTSPSGRWAECRWT